MGQLERYGLYVLVLVIFLILGVAIWGGEPSDGSPGNVPNDPSPNPIATLDTAGIEEQMTPSERHIASFIVPGDEFETLPVQGESSPGQVVPERPPVGDPPAHTPEPAPQPAPAALRRHVIRPGDTLTGIALATLGSIRHWKAIEAANPGIDKDNLPLGKEIVIPEVGSAQSAPAAPARGSGPRTYKVESGDNPASISKRFFGTEKYDKLIMQANGITDPKKLQVGILLTIPDPQGR